MMTASVCLSVREHISGTTRPIFTKFLCMLLLSVARPSSGGVAVRHVLPVSWITSYVLILGHMQGCRCDTGTVSQPGGAARRLGCRPWLKQLAVSW